MACLTQCTLQRVALLSAFKIPNQNSNILLFYIFDLQHYFMTVSQDQAVVKPHSFHRMSLLLYYSSSFCMCVSFYRGMWYT